MPILLCYNLSGDEASKVRFSAMSAGIRVREVKPEEYELTLAALCDGESAAAPSEASESFTEEMLVMAGFANAQIERFLQTLRRVKAAPVRLKAVLTDTNARWDSVKLHAELSAEREALKQAGKPAHEAE